MEAHATHDPGLAKAVHYYERSCPWATPPVGLNPSKLSLIIVHVILYSSIIASQLQSLESSTSNSLEASISRCSEAPSISSSCLAGNTTSALPSNFPAKEIAKNKERTFIGFGEAKKERVSKVAKVARGFRHRRSMARKKGDKGSSPSLDKERNTNPGNPSILY